MEADAAISYTLERADVLLIYCSVLVLEENGG